MAKKKKPITPWPFALYLKCPACGHCYHQTSASFQYGQTYNGRMFQMRHRYGPGGENWQTFPADEAVLGDCLICPGCEVPYVEIGENLYWDRDLTRKFDPADLVPGEKKKPKASKPEPEPTPEEVNDEE
ncbi:MAG TPA: hypothetical protein VJ934_08640 [Desulfomicrobiaceae bacterium]|nr:hypothetical protein [Desulfomicrobiaceae bacterium]